MTVPGEGAPQRPDDEVIAADQQRMADGAAQQAQVDAILAESRARIAPWEEPIAKALTVSNAIVSEYGIRAKAGGTTEVELDAEDGVPVIGDSDLFLARLAPSTVIVQVEKNELTKDPRSWWNRYLSYAKETPLKYGWTVAERQVAEEEEATTTTAQGGGRLDALLSDIDGPAGATAKSKVELDDIDEEDDAIPYDVNAIVERVILVNGAKNALLLVKGKRGELDKAFEDGKANTPTRIASAKELTPADSGNEKSVAKVAKANAGLKEYLANNKFADVSVSVLSRKAIENGEISLTDPGELADLVYDGLCAMMERVQESRRERRQAAATR